MDDRAKQLAALLKETYLEITGGDSVPSSLTAVAAVLAPIVARVEQSEAQISRMMYPGATERCGCGHLRMDHAENGYDNTEPCCNRDCTCRDFSEVPRKRSAAPAPVPQPGATRGAEVAERMIAAFAANVRWICTKAIDTERAAARAQAFTEVEEVVLNIGARGQGAGPALKDAAVAVARLREAT